jgi:uncharacterized membrane protein YbhN (UPF0104 family)
MSRTRVIGLARLLAFLMLAVVTIYGGYRFVTGDWTDVTNYWSDHLEVFLLVVVISIIDVALEGLAWMWVYRRFQIRTFDRDGCCAFLAGRAGLVLPVQLGRLIRPDAIVKLQRAGPGDALKAEGVVFVLDCISVIALLAALLAYKSYPAAAPFVAVAVIAIMIFLGNTINRFVTHTHLQLPPSFWWAWPTLFIILIDMAGWLAHGLALHVVVVDLPGEMTLWDSLFFAPGSAVAGVATGLPGGIGATEGILGASLRLRSMPIEHLAIAVAAFRLITFWLWIPIGWLALAVLRRRVSRLLITDTAALPKEEDISWQDDIRSH